MTSPKFEPDRHEPGPTNRYPRHTPKLFRKKPANVWPITDHEKRVLNLEET